MNPFRLLIAIVSLAALALGGWLALRPPAPPAEPVVATILPQPVGLPDFALVDQHGEPFTRADLEGRWNLLFFGFTHCPDVCPLTLQVLASALRQLEAAGQAPLPRVVFVSVDPERDSPAIVRDYVGYFDAETVGLTGPEQELRRLADGLGIFFARADGNDNDYLVDHSAVVLVVGPDARFRALFSAPHEVDKFVADLPLITGGA